MNQISEDIKGLALLNSILSGLFNSVAVAEKTEFIRLDGHKINDAGCLKWVKQGEAYAAPCFTRL